jgi:hypothetical protein
VIRSAEQKDKMATETSRNSIQADNGKLLHVLVLVCPADLHLLFRHSPGTYLSTALSTVSTFRFARLPSKSIELKA